MESKPATVEVAADALAPATLRSLVEEFVTRDGTDYGEAERSLAEKVANVERQIETREVRIVFDEETETVNLVRAEEINDS